VLNAHAAAKTAKRRLVAVLVGRESKDLFMMATTASQPYWLESVLQRQLDTSAKSAGGDLSESRTGHR
jgi:hypothetical protein